MHLSKKLEVFVVLDHPEYEPSLPKDDNDVAGGIRKGMDRFTS